MTTNRTRRFLAVARRAASFRTMVQSAEVTASLQKADDCGNALAEGQALTLQARGAWRSLAGGAAFHVATDAYHRRFHRHLVTLEHGLVGQAQEAAEQLDRTRTALGLELARRDGLQSSLDKATRRQREEHNRQALKEADDTWNILRNRLTDEDR
ncbi:hypothetical protein [Aquabacterium sp.]|uniref:hypothetical protein n=1 Tax=Aquabacterium sp. TaxID=1872578 RepID=UPI002CAE517C|nr:hypothetical protein [Aquabacterium sp.]HSW06364.1 hypothetical protein [Aquabacterium sp.]